MCNVSIELLGVRYIQKPHGAHADFVERHNKIMRELLADIGGDFDKGSSENIEFPELCRNLSVSRNEKISDVNGFLLRDAPLDVRPV